MGAAYSQDANVVCTTAPVLNGSGISKRYL
jgi:hypothetical protein